MPPSIAIVGAGPAGLTLANLLESLSSTNKVSVSIFDLDASETSRTHQGGTLDLHPPTGLKALAKMGLMETAKPFLRYEGEEMTFADKNGMRFVHQKDAPQIEGFDARPEIDREKLKEILLKAYGESRVQWGKKIKHVDVGRTPTFDDGTTAGPFDLIVGADGAWSRVRALLSDVKPAYSGVCGFEGHIDEPSEAISNMVGRGSFFAYSDGQSIGAQRMGDNSIKVGTWVKREKEWAEKLAEETGMLPEKVKPRLLEEFHEWVDEMTDWIRVSTRLRKWVLWELPVGFQWEHKQGFTLMGDAAHLCTPFAGLGVNAAMADALELAELIEKCMAGETSLDEAVAMYEKQMYPRAKKVQEDTMRNKEGMFKADAPVGFMVDMIGVVGKEVGWPIDKGWLYWVPISKIAFCVFSTMSIFGRLRRKVRKVFAKQKTV